MNGTYNEVFEIFSGLVIILADDALHVEFVEFEVVFKTILVSS